MSLLSIPNSIPFYLVIWLAVVRFWGFVITPLNWNLPESVLPCSAQLRSVWFTDLDSYSDCASTGTWAGCFLACLWLQQAVWQQLLLRNEGRKRQGQEMGTERDRATLCSWVWCHFPHFFVYSRTLCAVEHEICLKCLRVKPQTWTTDARCMELKSPTHLGYFEWTNLLPFSKFMPNINSFI